MIVTVSLAIVLASATLIALWAAAGLIGIAYVLIFAAAAAPGVPIGIMLFGRRHSAAWVTGGLVGYGLTQLVLWAVIAAKLASIPAFAVGWLLTLLVVYGASRRVRKVPAIPRPDETAADLRALFLVVLLVPVLMGVTYRNLGRADEGGSRYYRAYFTADFVWHRALAFELGKFSLPPQNPYLAPQTMNYYWTYFLLPSVAARYMPAAAPAADEVEPQLKANAILVGVLMIAVLFITVRSAASSAAAAAVAVVLAVAAASAEGTYAIIDLLTRGRPLAGLLDTNIDAITAWVFGGLRVDNVPRSLWYTPQHTTSIALGLAGLHIAIRAGSAARPAAIAASGLALGLSTTMNPLLGGICSLLYGSCIAFDVLATRGPLLLLLRHAPAAAFVAAAILWGAASSVVDGAGSALDIGFSGFSRRSPVITLLLSLGPVLVPAIAALFIKASGDARRAVVVGATGIAVGLFFLYCVRISEASWVGFRAGQVLLVSIPILLARTIEWLPRPPRVLLVACILIAGLPTTVVDTYNAQDIANRRPGPGFRWTLYTTPAQQEAFAWLRAHTPDTAVVQMEPIVRAREHWTLIPSFAGRRMAAGQPISLMPIPEYQERSLEVRHIFSTENAGEAAAVARRLRIDYLYVDRDDVLAYPAGVRKFDGDGRFFERVFANREVRIYRVK